jgi:uncharacterized membrane protein YebE (DUF533 family)
LTQSLTALFTAQKEIQMNAIDILGELLGHKTSQPSRGGDVLKDIFGRSSSRTSTTPPKKPGEIKSEAQELEDLLNVANDRARQRRTSAPANTTAHPDEYANSSSNNEKALVLLRAMINASMADGKLDQAEQKKIIDRLDAPDKSSIDFLRKEFASPLDLNEFIRSVPVGMEQQVYTASLIAIDLDTGTEADYLMQLSRGLRIPDDAREQIHQRVGAPSVY